MRENGKVTTKTGEPEKNTIFKLKLKGTFLFQFAYFRFSKSEDRRDQRSFPSLFDLN